MSNSNFFYLLVCLLICSKQTTFFFVLSITISFLPSSLPLLPYVQNGVCPCCDRAMDATVAAKFESNIENLFKSSFAEDGELLKKVRRSYFHFIQIYNPSHFYSSPHFFFVSIPIPIHFITFILIFLSPSFLIRTSSFSSAHSHSHSHSHCSYHSYLYSCFYQTQATAKEIVIRVKTLEVKTVFWVELKLPYLKVASINGVHNCFHFIFVYANFVPSKCTTGFLL